MALEVVKLTDSWVFTDAVADAVVRRDIAFGPATLKEIYLANPGDSLPAEAFLLLWDEVNPTVNTTPPVEIIPVPKYVADSLEHIVSAAVNGGKGLYFRTGLSFAVVQAGGTAPANSVNVTLVVDPD